MNPIKKTAAPAALRLALLCALAAAAQPALPHGFAGKRFFPATLATDDPFVADELSLPTVSSRKLAAAGDSPATRETDASIDLAKRITPNLGLGLGLTHKRLQPEGGDVQSGLDNLAVGLKYQFYKSDEHESIASVGIDLDLGHTGAKRVGAESFSTVTPGIFVGKGFGDLPESMKYLRPLALTGVAGITMPTKASTTTTNDDGDVTVERHPNVLNWGFAVQYNLSYLQSFVKDVGLGEPFNRLIPVVEFAMQTPIDRGRGGTTGTVNPGFIWAGRYFQLGLEAVVPANDRTGGKVGFIAQLHFFLDDLYPRSLGRPIFGG